MVKRWYVHEAFRMEDGLIVERKVGNVYSSNPGAAFVDVVLASDYDALAARLAEQDMQLKSYADRLAECEAECLEQARCNGKGSEREARLMARLARMETALCEIANADGMYVNGGYRSIARDALKPTVSAPARCVHNYIEHGITHCLMCGEAIAPDSAPAECCVNYPRCECDEPDSASVVCAECNGTGQSYSHAHGELWRDCESCNGSGATSTVDAGQ